MVVWSALLVDTLILIIYTYTLKILYYSPQYTLIFTYIFFLYFVLILFVSDLMDSIRGSAEKQRINSWAGPWLHTFSLHILASFFSLTSPSLSFPLLPSTSTSLLIIPNILTPFRILPFRLNALYFKFDNALPRFGLTSKSPNKLSRQRDNA